MEVIGATRPVLRVSNAVGTSPVPSDWTALSTTVGMPPRAVPNLTGIELGPITRSEIAVLT